MKPQPSPESTENPRQPMDWLFKMNQNVQELTRSKEEDSTFMLVLKVFARLMLIGLLILLSPVLLIGLTIAFIAVF
ncbi:MAG: hypothetical protein SFU99_06145 [Saprospiraceae bacterium]|nr:hypothetical protein [Saprospiraceae bacterium]